MSCQNGNVGSVVINNSGGWGGNSYELEQPDSSIRGPQASSVFSNLTQDGTYTVTVTDLNGCSVTDTFSLRMIPGSDQIKKHAIKRNPNGRRKLLNSD